MTFLACTRMECVFNLNYKKHHLRIISTLIICLAEGEPGLLQRTQVRPRLKTGFCGFTGSLVDFWPDPWSNLEGSVVYFWPDPWSIFDWVTGTFFTFSAVHFWPDPWSIFDRIHGPFLTRSKVHFWPDPRSMFDRIHYPFLTGSRSFFDQIQIIPFYEATKLVYKNFHWI